MTVTAGYHANGSVIVRVAPCVTSSSPASTVTVPAGYYSSQATKSCSDANLVSGNIKSGVTIFGVSGATNVVDTTIASSAAAAANILNGYKAYANGALVEGSATVPTVSQDSQTKVLSIS